MSGRNRGLIAAAILLALPALAWCPAPVLACDTPVYRYAMYNWPPAPYVVFYFYWGQPAAEDEAVNRLLSDPAAGQPGTANVAMEAVDLAKCPLARLPEPVRKAWESRAELALPVHMVFAPWEAELFVGRLDEATAQAMVESPARSKTAELIDQGSAIVFLFLPGADAEENRRAEAAIKDVIDQGASGRIPVATPMDDAWGMGGPGEPPPDDGRRRDANRLELAVVRVDRQDPAEKWLIQSLMAIEDLSKEADQPMVFAVYGRGRAMPAYLGKGITAENLAELAAFLAGACSCTVKDQNPGFDLLVRWDWDATADRLAASDPSLNPQQPLYQEFTPGAAEPAAEASGNAPAVPAQPVAEGPKSEPAAAKPEPGKSASASTEAKLLQPARGAAKNPGSPASGSAGPRPAGRTVMVSFARSQMLTYGLGFVLAVVIVLAVGLMLTRRRDDSP